MNEKRQVELGDLDWEDRERVLRLMFSKMNTGQPATNWRIGGNSRDSPAGNGIDAKTSEGMGSKRKLDQSFREDEEDGYDYDQEVEDNASNTNIFRKTNAEDYGGSGSVVTTKKGS